MSHAALSGRRGQAFVWPSSSLHFLEEMRTRGRAWNRRWILAPTPIGSATPASQLCLLIEHTGKFPPRSMQDPGEFMCRETVQQIESVCLFPSFLLPSCCVWQRESGLGVVCHLENKGGWEAPTASSGKQAPEGGEVGHGLLCPHTRPWSVRVAPAPLRKLELHFPCEAPAPCSLAVW